MVRFPLVIAVSERDMSGIEPGPLGWHTSALTNELQEVILFWVWIFQNVCHGLSNYEIYENPSKNLKHERCQNCNETGGGMKLSDIIDFLQNKISLSYTFI